MVVLTRLDGKELVVNADHKLTLEATPPTLHQRTTRHHRVVRVAAAEVIERVAEWRRRCAAGPERRGAVVAFPRGVPPAED